jgi:hypothetical protein
MDAVETLLAVAFRHVINEPSIEAGYARFHEIVAEPIDETAFRDAVAAALRDRLIRDPIRLPEGALQCHWHLELTPKGVEAVRKTNTISSVRLYLNPGTKVSAIEICNHDD